MHISSVFNPFASTPNSGPKAQLGYPSALPNWRYFDAIGDSVHFSGKKGNTKEAKSKSRTGEIATGAVEAVGGGATATLSTAAVVVAFASGPPGWVLGGFGLLGMLIGAKITEDGVSKMTGNNEDSNGVITGTV